MAGVITDAGKLSKALTSGDRRGKRRDLVKEVARRLRAAKDDDEAADALEAAIELARMSED